MSSTELARIFKHISVRASGPTGQSGPATSDARLVEALLPFFLAQNADVRAALLAFVHLARDGRVLRAALDVEDGTMALSLVAQTDPHDETGAN